MTGEKMTRLDGADWLMSLDPMNRGREREWWREPQPDAINVHVPGLIQEYHIDYMGVVWYWKDFTAPVNPHLDGRYLLRILEIDYLAEIWINGRWIGCIEGAQEPFVLDATAAVMPEKTNRMAVRLLLPPDNPVDGYTYAETPHGVATRYGGIMDSVELLAIPSVHAEDIFTRTDWKSGEIKITATVHNYSLVEKSVRLLAAAAPAKSGENLDLCCWNQILPPGRTVLETSLMIRQHRLWQLNDPYLYRISLSVAPDDDSLSEISTRCGFRDFRFENGYFRLNGKRIYLKNAHHGAEAPSLNILPDDPGMLRLDLINMKDMGFNIVRFIARTAFPYMLDLADEIGLMVYEESYAAWLFANSPKMPERFDRSVSAMIKRDRNHPSVVIWGLMNETADMDIVNHAAASLPMVRRLDPGRMVFFGSGRFDSIGNYINGLEIRSPGGKQEPNAIFNPMQFAVCFCTLWPSGSLSLNPGTDGEYSVARFTVPCAGIYEIKAVFRGTSPFATTDVHVYRGKDELYGNHINLHAKGDRCCFEQKQELSAGETVDFIVGFGEGNDYGGWMGSRWVDNTVVDVKIRDDGGKEFDAAAQFQACSTCEGSWSFGYMPAGLVPDISGFTAYDGYEIVNKAGYGSLSNPGSDAWDDTVADQHYYPRVPHRLLEYERLRTIAGNSQPLYLAEYGIGSGVNLSRLLRHYEHTGKNDCHDARTIKKMEAAFLEYWEKWRLDEAFAGPDDFFRKSIARMGGLRKRGINALRSNPNIVGYSLTSYNDPYAYGEGLVTSFREAKPGTFDALRDCLYPLRWCLFTEPFHIYSGGEICIEAVLLNEDMLAPGDYPVRFTVVDPRNRVVFNSRKTLTIPHAGIDGMEPGFVIPALKQKIVVSGPTGCYRLTAVFEKGAAAAGEEIEFHVMNRDDMPLVPAPVLLWSDDRELYEWLDSENISVRKYDGRFSKQEVILVTSEPAGGHADEKWADLTNAISSGIPAVFLDPGVFSKGGEPLGRLPLENKGTIYRCYEYTFPSVYLNDEWAKSHPVFEGLPAGGMMDHAYYREIIPDRFYTGMDKPEETVSGAFHISSCGSVAYLMNGVYKLGRGSFILNALRVRQALKSDPVAERLLRNMLNYADGLRSE